MSSKKQHQINWNHAQNMDVDAWRTRQIHKHLMLYLERREQAFIREHGEDTDEELVELVRKKASELHRMPHPMELEGGQYLQERLGEWKTLARSLGYAPVGRHLEGRINQQLREQAAMEFVKERKAIKAARGHQKKKNSRSVVPAGEQQRNDP